MMVITYSFGLALFFDRIGAVFDHLVKVLVALGALCYHRIIKGRSTSE